MSTVKIDYSDLKEASNKAKKASSLYSDCLDEVQRKVSTPIQNIQGVDSYSYVGSATSLILEKKNILANRRDRLNKISENIANLEEEIKQHDINVKNKVNTVAYAAFDLQEQSPFKAFTQWLYGTICVDALNWNPVTRWIGDKLKAFNDWASNKLNKIFEYFKYGNGRYWLNIGMSALAAVASIFATVRAFMLLVAATTATVATGGVAAPFLIAAIASTIGTVLTIGDAIEVVTNNVKAYQIDIENSDPGRARYYADISGVKDAISKYDYGGKGINTIMSMGGTAYDILHGAADLTAFAAGAYGKAGLNIQLTRNVDGKITGKEVTWNKDIAKYRLKEGFKQKIGFDEGGSWKAKNIFKTKTLSGPLGKDKLYTEHVLKDQFESYDIFKNSEKAIKIVKKGTGAIKNVDKLFGHKTTGIDRLESGVKIIKEIPIRGSKIISDLDTILGALK